MKTLKSETSESPPSTFHPGGASSTALCDRKRSRKHGPRIPHTKSRRGCNLCKKRKVKASCDEQRPSCFNCTRLQEICEYRTLPPVLRSVSKQSILSASDRINLQDLELFHVYSTSTYATLSLSPTLRDFWKITVPHLAFQYEYLMREIFALSALHLARHRPEHRDSYMSTALTHHQVASREALKLLQDVRNENVACLFMFSALTIPITLATPKRDSFGEIPADEGSFEDWIYLIQGTKQLRDILGADISESPLAPLLKFGAERWELQCPSTVTDIYRNDMLCELQNRINVHVEDPGRLCIYTETINSLRSAAYCSINWEGADAFVWIYRCIDGFLPLLELSTQEALAILAHFCVMVKKAETQWWLQGWADRIISEVYRRLDAEHKAWIHRPAEEMGWVAPVA
ncbi:C6 zinc finger protein [Thelonectria olida]|uniref:C6 zinc finger protein n=1 Tax=Thelonectria olida TaxID=1576542 RepID=A0A9P8VW63_9HYPO|nr:C6 zinc finger protein [Thelonectria olida]